MIYEYFTELFENQSSKTENECFKILKNHSEDPNFIAIPWTSIMNSDREARKKYIEEINKIEMQQDNNFTVCQYAKCENLIPFFKKLNITKVFSTSSVESLIDGITFIPLPSLTGYNFKFVPKDIKLSFIGAINNSLRLKFKMRSLTQSDQPNDNIEQPNSNVMIFQNNHKITEDDYKNILERSRFHLCIKGKSPPSRKFWECLQAGVIPILVSDNWMLPKWNWENAIIHITEKQFETVDLDALINTISPEMEIYLRSNCLNAYNEFKIDNCLSYISINLKNLNVPIYQKITPEISEDCKKDYIKDYNEYVFCIDKCIPSTTLTNALNSIGVATCFFHDKDIFNNKPINNYFFEKYKNNDRAHLNLGDHKFKGYANIGFIEQKYRWLIDVYPNSKFILTLGDKEAYITQALVWHEKNNKPYDAEYNSDYYDVYVNEIIDTFSDLHMENRLLIINNINVINIEELRSFLNLTI